MTIFSPLYADDLHGQLIIKPSQEAIFYDSRKRLFLDRMGIELPYLELD
jgi:hypothetical protein